MALLTWTDERLDDRFQNVDKTFDRVDRDLGDLRTEMRELRAEMRAGFAEVRGEIDGLRTLIFRGGAAIVGSVIVASLLQNL